MPRKTFACGLRPALPNRFNEAGAECPGKLAPQAGGHAGVRASMRPGLNAPENHLAQVGGEGGGVASMRPGLNAPENYVPCEPSPNRTTLQ